MNRTPTVYTVRVYTAGISIWQLLPRRAQEGALFDPGIVALNINLTKLFVTHAVAGKFGPRWGPDTLYMQCAPEQDLESGNLGIFMCGILRWA